MSDADLEALQRWAERLARRARVQRRLATIAPGEAERVKRFFDGLAEDRVFADAFEDEPDVRIWIGRAIDALREAGRVAEARARANENAVRPVRGQP